MLATKVQVGNLTLGTDNLEGLAKVHILDHTNLELDNQAKEIHILVATTEAKQEEGVDQRRRKILILPVVQNA